MTSSAITKTRRRSRVKSEDLHKRRISVGSLSYTISSCDVDDLPVDLLFYAHSGQDIYQNISKIKCLDIHDVNPWILCGNVDGGITIWDYEKRCELHQLETWPKSLELVQHQEKLRQTQPSSYHHYHNLQDTIVFVLFWKHVPDTVVVLYDDRIDIFNLFSKELVSQTIIPKLSPTSAVVLKHSHNILCISCMDGTIRMFDRSLNKIVQNIETPEKSITHLIEIDGLDHLYLSIDKNGPAHLWKFYFPASNNDNLNYYNENVVDKSSNDNNNCENGNKSENNANYPANLNTTAKKPTSNTKPICELVDVHGKHLHQNINWASFTSSTGELLLSNRKNRHYNSFDFSIFMEANSIASIDGILKCKKVYSVTSRFVHAQHLNHPAFPPNAIVGFRNRKATVEVVDPAVDHALEIFDLRKLRKNLPSKVKIYTMDVKDYFIICGTNVGIFVVNLWANYNIPKLPLKMGVSNIEQLFVRATTVGSASDDNGLGFGNEGIQSPLLRTAVKIQSLPSTKSNLFILYWPLLRNYSICSRMSVYKYDESSIQSADVVCKPNVEWSTILNGHSKSVALCTVDGEVAVVLSLTTERIISLQTLKNTRSSKANNYSANSTAANISANKSSRDPEVAFVTNGPQGIFVIPENMDDGVHLYGGGPLAILTLKNNTSTFLDIVEEKLVDASKTSTKYEKHDDGDAKLGDREEEEEDRKHEHVIKKYTLQPIGPKLPLIHLVEWSNDYEYCAVASGDHVHIFTSTPKFRHCRTIPLAMGGPGTSIHLSSNTEGYKCRSMLWYNNALFLLTNNNVYVTFPFNKMSGEGISLITLATRKVNDRETNLQKYGNDACKCDTLHPTPFNMPRNAGSILDQISLINPSFSNKDHVDNRSNSSKRIHALNIRVSSTKNVHLNTFEKKLLVLADNGGENGTSDTTTSATNTTPCMFYPIPLTHPTIKFKLLIASKEINEALKYVREIDNSHHDHLSIFLCGHGYYKEAINRVPGLTKSGMLECILNNKNELKAELPRLIEHSVCKEHWMIQHVAIGLAEEKNVEQLEKLLELCMKTKLWNNAMFVSSFLPLHLQMKTAGIIARQERKRIQHLKGNMAGIEAMAKVTTIAKYRPKFSSSTNVSSRNKNEKYKKIWSKMPSTESLRRAWNEELAKNFYIKDNVKISRNLNIKKE